MKTITLQIPDELYARIEQAAADSARSTEAVLQDSIDIMFSEPTDNAIMEALLAAMPFYTERQLWAVVYGRLPLEKSFRLHELVDKAKQGATSTSEESELDELVALVDRYMLLRSEALVMLKERGHDIDSYWKTGG